MARFSASNPTAEAVGTSTTEQLVQLTNNADLPIVLEEIHCDADGVSATAQKTLVELCRVASGAEGTGTAITPKKYDRGGNAPIATALLVDEGDPATPRDLGGGELDTPWRRFIHLQGGITYRFPNDGLLIPAGESVIIRVLTGTTGANFIAGFVWREGN